jgi:hypothetical protein
MLSSDQNLGEAWVPLDGWTLDDYNLMRGQQCTQIRLAAGTDGETGVAEGIVVGKQ